MKLVYRKVNVCNILMKLCVCVSTYIYCGEHYIHFMLVGWCYGRVTPMVINFYLNIKECQKSITGLKLGKYFKMTNTSTVLAGSGDPHYEGPPGIYNHLSIPRSLSHAVCAVMNDHLSDVTNQPQNVNKTLHFSF